MEVLRSDILGTKLYIPRVRSSLVHRERLAKRLEAGMNCALTLVCAPAGFGKTTLLVDWLLSRESETQAQVAVAWFSLDGRDNDPVQFIRYLIAAVYTAVPEIGEPVLTMVRSPELPPLRTSLTVLINELMASQREIILVLEDYHAIRQLPIHESVTFLLEHAPPLLHVVIATREDPPFPLLQLRAHGAVCELRASDLRFTTEETAAFLREVMDLPVSADDVAALEARTEGWIAGLQLAALSMPAGDISGSIAAFGGSHRYILDYLRNEVLARQPRTVQTFLLHTSVLDRLSGPLCDAVLGNEPPNGSQSLLEEIERRNLFLTSLDADGRWYRYHHLFADLLRIRLRETEPSLVPELHHRASEWYEQHGLVHEAIAHALAAPDPSRAARLIEQHGLSFFLLGQIETMLGWFHALPAGAVRSRPLLCYAYAYALYLANQGEAAETYLQAAEQHLRSDLPSEEARLVRGRIATLRSVMSRWSGDPAQGVALAVEALDLLPASDLAGRALARVYAAWAFRVNGDVTSASERAVATAVEQAKTAGLQVATRIGISLHAQLHMLQGRLQQARGVFVEAERVLGLHVVTGATIYYFGLGDLLREWNDLDGAERLLKQGLDAMTEIYRADAYVVAHGYIATARLRQARDDSSGAIAILDEFVRLARRRKFAEPTIARAAAARAHLWLMQGNLAAATHWADTSGLGPDDPVSYPRELEYLILARVLIARKSVTSLTMLDRLLQDAEAHGRMGSAIEILALRALALQALGDPTLALQALERALALGGPEGYVRVFVDEGAAMATLLRRARTGGIAPDYAARLLGVFRAPTAASGPSDPAAQVSTMRAPAQPRVPSVPVEPLTAREREVLRLIVAGASNREIARRLAVATDTVKKHVYHLFGKLDVKSRTQAAIKARALEPD